MSSDDINAILLTLKLAALVTSILLRLGTPLACLTRQNRLPITMATRLNKSYEQ